MIKNLKLTKTCLFKIILLISCILNVLVLNILSKQHNTQGRITRQFENIIDSPIHIKFVKKQNQEKEVKRIIKFVHVGKTGGRTAKCLIKRLYNRTKVCKVTPNNITTDDLSNDVETEISRQFLKYFHLGRPRFFKNSTLLVTSRHPISRFISWYLYQHPLNEIWQDSILRHAARHNVSLSDKITSQLNEAHKVFECFPQLDSLATLGLSEKRQHSDDCQELATRCVRGILAKCKHMFWNYERYLKIFLNEPTTKFYVLRTENFWDDWQRINTLLGGGAIVRGKDLTHVAENNKPLVVTNKTMSQAGIQNVCRVLCHEICFYKLLINRAINLNPHDKNKMIENLRSTCPLEASYQDRTKCGNYGNTDLAPDDE